MSISREARKLLIQAGHKAPANCTQAELVNLLDHYDIPHELDAPEPINDIDDIKDALKNANTQGFSTPVTSTRRTRKAKGSETPENTTKTPENTPKTPENAPKTPKNAPFEAEMKKGNKTSHLADALEDLLSQQTLDEQRVLELIRDNTPETKVNTLVVFNTRTQSESKPIDNAHHLLPKVLDLLEVYDVTGCFPYLVGPAGSGKTTLARHAATALSLNFHFTASVLDKFELIGFVDANGIYQESAFFKAFTQGGVFLFDELDASATEALTAFNAALNNKIFTFPDGETYEAHIDFLPIGAGNTLGNGANREYNSRNVLDGATLNRIVPLHVGYCPEMECSTALNCAYSIDPETDKNNILKWVDFVMLVREQLKDSPQIISPRQSQVGATLIAKGYALDEVKNLTVYAFLTEQQKTQVESYV